MTCVEYNYITTPKGVPSIFGKPPNELLFPERHSYLLSTPENYGDLRWLVWGGKVNTGLPTFAVGQNIIESSGVQEHGTRVTMLRVGGRLWNGLITIRPDELNDRISFVQNLRMLYSILSYDNATAVTSDNELPLPFSLPNPFTYTWVDGNAQRFHLDFTVAWLDGVNDSSQPAPTLFNGSLSFYSPDPHWYSDTLTITTQSRANVSSTIVPEFSYYGSARTPWDLTINVSDIPSTVRLNEISLIDTTDGERIGHIRPIAGVEWYLFNGSHPQTINLDIRNKLLSVNNAPVNSICPTCITDWVSLWLVPYRTYRIVLDIGSYTGNQIIDSTLTYRPRYVGI